jgi:hypothetical protein
MNRDIKEYSESGSPIYRHQNQEPREFRAPVSNPAQGEIDTHISKYMGNVDNVFHEVVSDLIHVDIYISHPSPERNYYTLITSGMSSLPMHPSDEYQAYKYTELFLCLPSTWPMTDSEFRKDENYWPFRCLKYLARFPHEYKTWIWKYHTIPNGNPMRSYSPNTKLSCAMLSFPTKFEKEFYKLRISQNKTIYFHSVLMLYKEEIEYKLKHGAESLMELFNSNGISELVDIKRNSVVKKKLFGIL